jgi:heme A synthase
LFLQLVAGAILRHTGNALAIHVAGAVIAGGSVIFLASSVLREKGVPRALSLPAQGLALLLFVQVTLGVTALAAGVPRPVSIATAHVAIGASLLGLTLLVTLWGWRFRVEDSSPVALAKKESKGESSRAVPA